MQRVTIPVIGADLAWRDAARAFLASEVPPHEILWGGAMQAAHLFAQDLFAAPPTAIKAPRTSAPTTVPRSFIALAQTVVWHNDPERFARLYAFLWRLRDAPYLMTDRADPDLARLRQMQKGVHRCQHKMKAFVRFREIGAPQAPRRSFAAWFEPTHHTLEPTADFFVRRFGDMDWRILTPDVTAIFENRRLTFAQGQPKPDLPEDAGEQLWITYFRNIFNPARLKINAMQSEMPKKYWKNLPEAASIADLIAGAQTRARAMAEAAPTLPPARMAQVQAQLAACTSAWEGPKGALPAAISGCTRCPLHQKATQAVLGEGPANAALMIVGEQPGDLEDLSGKPFIGPAGQLFDQIAAQAGLDRQQAYVTNAVKHFKFEARGKNRLHQRPNSHEIEHCRWWLDAERALVTPKLILAMGATAAEALTGHGKDILARRGTVEHTPDGQPVLITLHPSYLLRLPDPTARVQANAAFRNDLRTAASLAS